MSLEQVIDKIKARVAAVDPADPRKSDSVVQLNVKSGDNTLSWVGDLKALEVTEGATPAADVTLDVNEEDLLAIDSQTMTIQDALACGRVQVSGNVEQGPALAELILS